MALSRRKFPAEFKLHAVRQVEAGALTGWGALRFPRLILNWFTLSKEYVLTFGTPNPILNP